MFDKKYLALNLRKESIINRKSYADLDLFNSALAIASKF